MLNSFWPNYNSHLAFWCWKFRCRAAEQSVSDAPWSPPPLEWRWEGKGCRHWDHFTSKPVVNSPYSPKIARAQSLTHRIKRPPKYRLVVAGKVEEQQSRWELFLKNIYFCNGFITLTPKPPVQHSFPLHIILGKITFDGKKKKSHTKKPPRTNSLVPNKLCPGYLWASTVGCFIPAGTELPCSIPRSELWDGSLPKGPK